MPPISAAVPVRLLRHRMLLKQKLPALDRQALPADQSRNIGGWAAAPAHHSCHQGLSAPRRPMTEPLTHESLAELRRDAESWLMIGGERVLPLLNALDAARAERDALAATVERVRALHVAYYPFRDGRGYRGICEGDEFDPYPCSTIRAINEEVTL